MNTISKFLHKHPLELLLVAAIILIVSSSNLQGLFEQLNLFKPKQIPISSTQPTPSPSPTEEVEELQFTKEELESYYAVYKNPFVLHIRKAFDSYLLGTNEGISEIAIKADKMEEGISGLDSFSKDYYKSKFIVFAINDGLFGGKIVNIVFQDKPDKLFNVWVYKVTDGSYELRGFWQNENFTEEEMQKIRKQYKVYLQDKEHAL